MALSDVTSSKYGTLAISTAIIHVVRQPHPRPIFPDSCTLLLTSLFQPLHFACPACPAPQSMPCISPFRVFSASVPGGTVALPPRLPSCAVRRLSLEDSRPTRLASSLFALSLTRLSPSPFCWARTA